MENPFMESAPITVRAPKSERREKPHRRPEGVFQKEDVADAREIHGFKDLDVVFTMEKKTWHGKTGPLNEDNVLADPHSGLLGVFDGVGGSADGAAASRVAERAIIENYETALRQTEDLTQPILQSLFRASMEQRTRETSYHAHEPRNMAELRLTAANDLVKGIFADPEMGKKAWALIESFRASNEDVGKTKSETTACVGLIHTSKDGKRWAVVANLGDSGALIRHTDGTMEQITEEDTVMGRFLRSGELSREKLFEMKKNPDKKFRLEGRDMDYYTLSVYLGADLGGQYFAPSLSMREMQPGEELIFCTDGVIDKFEKMVDASTDIKTFTREQTDFDAFAKSAAKGKTLVERLDNLRVDAAAIRAYKIVDDIAIVAARVPEVEKKHEMS